MATYYVSPSGSDSNNGLGPDASAATNKPWLTIGKALGASGISSGDTVYIGPGVYRETVTCGMTSPTVETFIIGDPLNTKEFKNGSGVLLQPKVVRLTAWTTDDVTAPSTGNPLTLGAKNHLTFQNISFWSSVSVACINWINSFGSTVAQNIKFYKCFLGGGNGFDIWIPAGFTLNAVIDSCIVSTHGGSLQPISIRHQTTGTGADWDMGITVQNCSVISSVNPGIGCTASGASSFRAGGLLIHNCFVQGFQAIVFSGVQSTIKSKVRNCIIRGQNAGIVANTTSDCDEDYNVIFAPTSRINVTAGTHSTVNACPLLDDGQSLLFGFSPKGYGASLPDSPTLGFGSDAAVTLTTDILGRDRPSGGGSTSKAVGPYENHDFATEETTVTDSGSGWKLIGPGDQAIDVPVDATSTTISIKVCYDTNHGTTNKPSAELLAAPDIGVSSGEVKTATLGAGTTFETLTFTAITPTRKSWVRILLHSYAAVGSGIAYFDTLTVT